MQRTMFLRAEDEFLEGDAEAALRLAIDALAHSPNDMVAVSIIKADLAVYRFALGGTTKPKKTHEKPSI